MAGAEGLKGAPESVADMDCRNNHCSDIPDHIFGLRKCGSDNLKNGTIRSVHKMKVEKVDDDKGQDENAGIGHGSGTDGAAAGSFFDGVSLRPCGQIFVKKDRADQGKKTGRYS